MARQVTPTRTVRSSRDVNLKLLRSKQVEKIKRQRAQFRQKVQKQQDRAKALTGQQKGKLQKKLSQKQLKRQQKQIKRNIAKKKRLKFQRQGGDIAFKDVKTNSQGWYNNFTSSNVWKFKIRGKNLLVAFLDGSVYLYFGAARQFLGMTRAGSKGSYVWDQLRRRGVAFTKII